jgi:hypothetical protein
MRNSAFVVCLLVSFVSLQRAGAGDLKLCIFEVDASPPIGSPLAYDPCVEITDPLSFRGVVLLGDEAPVVMCVVDWLGVANEAHEVWRSKLAAAVGTTKDRVALHAVHQHDAPRCDLSAAALLAKHGHADRHYDVPWIRDVMERSAIAAKESLSHPITIEQVGLGSAQVVDVASNRRILGDDGRVTITRYTACVDPKIRELPTGTVDPVLRSISFWAEEQPVAVLTYFATHPQSYYRTGQANPDFPGYARNDREQKTGVRHLHFNGAGGNVGAGKWNDGSRENRAVLSNKLAIAMQQAFDATTRFAVSSDDLHWDSVSVALPVGKHLVEHALVAQLESPETDPVARLTAAKHLAWLRRCNAGETIDVQCLSLGNARILHLPGELFVEYQMRATAKRPDLFVAVAAYGQYGPGYIGTEIAYSQGGYETSDRASRVAAESESVLNAAIDQLLGTP